jgi:hypothetical protein
MFQKDEVQQVSPEKKSLMPPYSGLAKDDLQNLLAYLDGLRGAVDTGATVKRVGGVR